MVFGIPNFTGHHYDAVLGQYYAKARMYSPDRKSFSAPDPVCAGRNWMAYCLNNPLSYTDIYGHEALAEPWWGQLWQQPQAKVDHFINDPYDVGVSWQQFFEHTTAADYKDMVGSGIMAAPNAALGEGIGMLSFMGKGVNSLGRFTVGNLFPSTRPYFERVHCGIDLAVDWVGDTFASDRAAYDFAHTATEKVVMPVYGTAKLVQGAYYGIKHGYGRIKNFLQDETGSLRIGGSDKGIGGSNGTYVKADYHGTTNNAIKNKAPNLGQEALDNSIPLGNNTTRRIGISDGEIVILDETTKGIFHGHVRLWDELSNSMQAALRKAGMVTKKGKIK